jgi:hypothetical protein
MEEFSFFDEEELNFIYITSKNIETIDYDICEDCNVKMTVLLEKNSLTCDNCGKIVNDAIKNGISVYSAKNYNTNNLVPNQSTPYFRDDFCEENLEIQKEDKNKIKKNNIEKQYKKIFYHDEGGLFSEEIIKIATELFLNISIHDILRGDNRKCVMAVCIYYVCINRNKVLESKIKNIMNISDKKFLKGLKLYKSYESQGLVKVPQLENSIDIYVNKFFIDIDINKYVNNDKMVVNYKTFVVILTRLMLRSRIAKTSTNKSKCVSNIYLLVILANINIKIDVIISACKISKTTIYKPIDRLIDILNKSEKVDKIYQTINLLFSKYNFSIDTLLTNFKRRQKKNRITSPTANENVNVLSPEDVYNLKKEY